MTQPANKLWTIVPTPAGFLKSRYPSGNDTAAPPSWATIPDFRQKSSAFSVDMVTYLTGSYTSMTLLVQTGTLSGSGWSFSGTTLTYSGTGSGLLTARVQANNGATVSKSNIFTFESITVQTADVIPGTIPVYIGVSLVASQPVITWKSSSDPAMSSQIWSGLKDYKIYRDGALLTTIATSTGLQFPLTQQTIGTPDVAGTFLRNASSGSISLTSSGINYANTSDTGEFVCSTLSGDFFASCKVSAFTCSNTLAKLMIDARSSTAQNSAHVAGTLNPFASNLGYNLYYRTANGAVTANNTQTAFTGSSIWMALERVGNVFTFSTSTDGVGFTVHSSVTVALPSLLYVGVAGCSQQAATSLTATVDQWSISQTASHTYTDTTAVTGTSYSYQLTSRDLALNESAKSASLSTGYKKWHVGHGVKDGAERSISASELSVASGYSKFGFVECNIMWGQVEPTIGNYDFSMVTTNLNALKAIGKRMVLVVAWKRFGSTSPANMIPADMINNAAYGNGYTANATTVGATANIWLSAVSDKYIAMLQALAAQFDSDPSFEMFRVSESAPSLSQPLPSSYTRPLLADQLKRIYLAGAIAFKNTIFCANINSLAGEVANLIEYAYSVGCGFSTPDATDTPAVIIFRGETAVGETGLRNYRGKMPYYTIASQPTLGGQDNNGPPSNIVSWAQTNSVTHLGWVTYVVSPNSLADIKTAIDASPTLYSACPTVYNNTCSVA
jgi:hypothetical protein